jgi:hypothetical protein
MDDETLTLEADQPIVLEAPASSDTAHRIVIVAHRYGPKGPYYQVRCRGEILLEDTREPLLDACRKLVSMGLKGRLEMWGGEAYPRMIVHDIEQGAKAMVVENSTESLRLRRYQPHYRE